MGRPRAGRAARGAWRIRIGARSVGARTGAAPAYEAPEGSTHLRAPFDRRQGSLRRRLPLFPRQFRCCCRRCRRARRRQPSARYAPRRGRSARATSRLSASRRRWPSRTARRAPSPSPTGAHRARRRVRALLGPPSVCEHTPRKTQSFREKGSCIPLPLFWRIACCPSTQRLPSVLLLSRPLSTQLAHPLLLYGPLLIITQSALSCFYPDRAPLASHTRVHPRVRSAPLLARPAHQK